MIEHALTLHTDLFEATTPGPNFINPRCFGEDFALWLVERLKTRSIEPSDPIQEDWGWALIVLYQGSRFTLSIGVMDESIGQKPAEWRVSVSYEKPLNGLRAWFRPPPSAELSRLGGVVEETLRSEPRIQQVVLA
jgi:hypothetical protein